MTSGRAGGHNLTKACRRRFRRNAEQFVKRTLSIPAPVPAEHAVDPRQQNVRSHQSDDFRLVVLRHTAVARKAAGFNYGIGINVEEYEPLEPRTGIIRDMLEADAPRAILVIFFNSPDDQHLADMGASLAAGQRIIGGSEGQ